jgi:hypothetical protein
MDNTPLTELDFASCDDDLDKGTIYEKVQSAKRLLKQMLEDEFKMGRISILQLPYINKDIDACFQIDDDKEAKE